MREVPGLELGFSSSFKSQDWPRIDLLGLDPSLFLQSTTYAKYFKQNTNIAGGATNIWPFDLRTFIILIHTSDTITHLTI